MQNPDSLERPIEKRLRETETRLADLEERYQHIVGDTHGLICTHDMDGVLLSINPAACELLGYESSEIIGRNLRCFLSPSRAPYFHIFLERINQNSVDKGILLLNSRDGRELTFQYHNIKITKNVEKPYVLGHAYDITEITELQEQLKQLTLTDDLTKLYNRRGFLELANQRMAFAQTTGESLVLIFADVDGLKGINDQLGHAAGSQAIIDAADILKDSFRQSDVISRLGGDEFVVLVANATKSSPDIITDRVREKIDGFNALSERPYKLSVSLGVVPVDIESKVTLDDIIAEADKSMYERKRKIHKEWVVNHPAPSDVPAMPA